MPTQLFSTYRQGENRVTATLLAVLQRLSLPNIDRILQALLGDSAFSLVTFVNQPAAKDTVVGDKAVPDARIMTGPAICIETKTVRNAADERQLRRHLQSFPSERLLLLTPDDSMPTVVNEIGDHRLVWSNFNTLANAITEDIIESKEEPPSEREAFLLREFILMLQQDRLLGSTTSTVMVLAARDAWPMYKRLGVYRCSVDKPMNSSRNPDRMAFYVAGEITPRVPKIRSVIESIDLTRSEEEWDITDVGQRELARELWKKIQHNNDIAEFGMAFKVMFLSEYDDDETVKLGRPIINDKIDRNGKQVPFTFGAPRYVTLESLQESSKTSESSRTSHLELC